MWFNYTHWVVTTSYLHLLRPCNLKNNASYEVKTKWFLFECRISAETYSIYNVTQNSRNELMHRAMNGSFCCTLARNFCRQSQRYTNPNQFQIHFRYSSKNLCPSHLARKVCKENNIVYNTDTVDQAENIAFTLSPVLSEKFPYTEKLIMSTIYYFRKIMSFGTWVAAQNLACVGLRSLNRLTYSLTPKKSKK